MVNDNYKKIAVLIDADNTQPSKMEEIFKDISAYGRIVTKRAYANWTKSCLKPWENEVKRFAISTIQQFDFVTNKNASDIALTIDAMELLYTGNYDCFVIVSSDSDFSSLAMKIHESGAFVVGYGKRNTSESFRSACDEFNYVEDLSAESGQCMAENKNSVKQTNNSETTMNESQMESKGLIDHKKKELSTKNNSIEQMAELSNDEKKAVLFTIKELDELLVKAEEKYAEDDGYVNVSSAGSYIKRVHSDFNIKKLGFDKLPTYIRSRTEKYEVDERNGKGGVKLVMYRSRKEV